MDLQAYVKGFHALVAANQNSGANQKQDANGDLHNDQSTTKTACSCMRGRATTRRLHEVSAGGLQRRRERETDGGCYSSSKHKKKNAPIELDGQQANAACKFGRDDGEKHAGAETRSQPGDAAPERSGGNGEHGSFGDELAYQARSRSAQSQAHANFALAGHGACQHYVGNIRAGE